LASKTVTPAKPSVAAIKGLNKDAEDDEEDEDEDDEEETKKDNKPATNKRKAETEITNDKNKKSKS